jgi:hypothetical protein
MKISKFISLATSVIAACIWQACTSEENQIATQQGYLSLSANVDGSFAMADGSTLQPAAAQVPDISDFSVTLASGEQYSHTWASFDEFPKNESYLVGAYTVTLSAEPRNGGPSYVGAANADIVMGQRTMTSITCKPADALMQFNVTQDNSAYSLAGITVHSDGGEYGEYAPDENLYIAPGKMQLYAQLCDNQSRSISIVAPYTTTLDAAHGEAVNVNLSENNLTFSSSKGDCTYAIDKSIFDLPAPAITAEGFIPGVQIDATEGITLSNNIKMLATAGREIKSARLTVQSPILNIVGAPSELDLMQLSSDDRDYLQQVGLKYTLSADKKSLNIDYTELLENMSSYTSALSRFSMMIEDVAGVCSSPLSLDVNTQVMTLQMESISTAVVGINKATMVINAGGHDIERQDLNVIATDADGHQVTCPITSWKQVDKQRVELQFDVPEGDSTVGVDVYYLDLKRFSANVVRVAPEYTIEVDAFATNAVVRISAETEEIAAAVAKYMVPTVEGMSSLNYDRYNDLNAVLVRNLEPGKKYTVSVSVAGTGKKTKQFTTEAALQVPEGDFEDWEQLIDYKQMPQGGKYSSTELSIVNRQNYVDIDVKWPKKYWASINAKTFNKRSSNHNTWYMQPSSVIKYEPQSGYKAICITSVGWDHNGEAIADYVQKHGESLPYSNTVPEVSHRSAGRLFLGSYSYDFATQKEVFNEGYAFSSRPSSLNGFFMYKPDVNHQSDRGYVEIEILNVTNGVETVIASGRAEFQAETDYKAFNVPLTYSYYNLKATKLKIMFASSTATGTQEFEDQNVPLTAHPESGVMSGSSLWIDNLSFTY